MFKCCVEACRDRVSVHVSKVVSAKSRSILICWFFVFRLNPETYQTLCNRMWTVQPFVQLHTQMMLLL